MSITFLGFQIARRALMAQQQAMNTAGHNIANANTPGFARQRVNLNTSLPYPAALGRNAIHPGQIGTGVEVGSITRMRDAFLDRQFRDQNVSLGRWGIRQQVLGQVEEVFNEPSEFGIRTEMDRFWQAWQTLANNPESLAAREVVNQRGQALADAFKYVDQRLKDFQGNLNSNVEATIKEINSLATQIADLNDGIRYVEATGMQANDLKDDRDRLLDRLAKLTDVQVADMGDGTIRVLTAGGVLVDSVTVRPLELVVDPLNNGYWKLEWRDLPSLPVQVTGGELAGFLEMRDTDLPGYRDQVKRLAWELASAVNAAHQVGYDLDGTNVAGEDWESFFVTDETVSPPELEVLFADFNLQKLRVNSNIIADGRKLAAAIDPGAPGDAANALAIAGIKFTPLGGLGTTADDYYRQTIATLGVQSQEAQRLYQTQSMLVEQVDQQRQSVMGVNLDEEMMNLIQFQHAFDAAARLMTVMDDMVDTIINRMGTVGR